jgi:predicted ester cyclase
MAENREVCEKVLHRYIDEVLNQHRDELLGEFIHPHFRHTTDEDALGLENDGRDFEGIKAGMREVREKLAPHYGATVTGWEGDTVLLDWSTRVTHQGDLFGRPATGRTFTLTYTGRSTFRDGKIISAHNVWDPQQAIDYIDA